MTDTAEFRPFPTLPPEIRIAIWKLVPQPVRMIGLLPSTRMWHHRNTTLEPDLDLVPEQEIPGLEEMEDMDRILTQRRFCFRYTCQPRQAAIFPPLHACREARSVWLPRFFRPPRRQDIGRLEIEFGTPFISYDVDLFTVLEAWPPIISTFSGVDERTEHVDSFICLDRERIRHAGLCSPCHGLSRVLRSLSIQELPSLRLLSMVELGPKPFPHPTRRSDLLTNPPSTMWPFGISSVDCQLRPLPVYAVETQSSLDQELQRHPASKSDEINRLYRQRLILRSLLWHEIRGAKLDSEMEMSEMWNAFLEYVFDRPNRPHCPLHLKGCGEFGHGKKDMTEWEPGFNFSRMSLIAQTDE